MPSEKVLQEKQQLVANLTEKLSAAKSGVVVSYEGITVADDTVLRRKLREAGVEYAVVKNTLLGRAADNAGYGDLKSVLEGSTALATSTEDELAAAKLLCALLAQHPPNGVAHIALTAPVRAYDRRDPLIELQFDFIRKGFKTENFKSL